MFREARDFTDTFRYLQGDPQVKYDASAFFCPVIVLMAYSLEIYLKCLATLAYGNQKGGRHDLQKLFNKIPSQSKSRIKEIYALELATHLDYFLAQKKKYERFGELPDPRDFDKILEVNKDAFENLRYLYENDSWPKLEPELLSIVVFATQKHLSEMKPEWLQPITWHSPDDVLAAESKSQSTK